MWARGKVSGLLSSAKDAAQEARKRACRAAEDGNHKGVRLLQQLKATASTMTPTKRTSTSGSGAGDLSGASPGSASSSAARRGKSSSPVADDPGIAALCRLGFSAAAARRALERCHGSLDEAGEWLLDGANADEILAAELQAQADAEPEAPQAEGLQPGSIARVVDLRAATQLNGTLVALLAWDEGSGRWVVEAPGGARKAIRSRNLQPMQVPERILEQSVAPPATAPRSQSSACAAATPEDDALAGLEVDPDLREALAGLSPAQVQEIMGSGGGMAAAPRKAFEPPPRRPPVQSSEDDVRDSQERALAAAKANSAASAAVGFDQGAEEWWRREAEEERRQLREAEQLSRASAQEAQEAWRAHADAEVARLEALESQCAALETDLRQRSQGLLPGREPWAEAKGGGGPGGGAAAGEAEHAELQLLQAEVLSMSQEFDEKRRLDREKSEDEEARQASLETLSQRHAAELAECEAHLQRVAAVHEAQASEPHAPAAAGDGAEMEAQRAELKALQEEVQLAARDLEEQREHARQCTQDRELQLLEEELQQRRAEDALLQEKAWLERQKRSTLAMQAAAKQMMESAPASDTGAFKQDGSFSCARAKLDEGEGAGEDGSDTAAEGEDADSEVWDLDWSELNRTRPLEEEEDDPEGEPLLAADSEPGRAVEHSEQGGGATGNDAGREEAGSTMPLQLGQSARLAPGQTHEESEEEECTLEDVAMEARKAASTSSRPPATAPEAPASGVQPLSDPEIAVSPARAEPA